MNILDNIYGTLFKPEKTFPELVNRDYLWGSFFIILILAVLNSLQTSTEYNFDGGTTFIVMLLLIGSYYFTWIMSSLFLTFTADFLGGSGKITDTMTGIAYALLPMMFLTPLYIITNTMGETGNSIYLICLILLNIWSFILIIISLKNIHQFHSTQAILSIVSIFFLFIFAGICLFFMTILGTVFILGQFA